MKAKSPMSDVREFDNSAEGALDLVVDALLERLRTGATIIACNFPEGRVEWWIDGEMALDTDDERTLYPSALWKALCGLYDGFTTYPVITVSIPEKKAPTGCLWAEQIVYTGIGEV